MSVAVALVLVAWNNLANLTEVFDRHYVALNTALAAALVGAAAATGWPADALGLGTGGLAAGVVTGAAVAGPVVLGLAAALRWPRSRRWLADDRVAGLSTAELRRRALWRIPVGTALAEEIVFRGVLFGIAGGGWSALTVSSAVFGLWHVVPTWQAARANGAGPRGAAAATAGGVVATAAAGAGLGWLRLATGSLAAPIIVHAAVNVGALLAAARAVGAVTFPRMSHQPRKILVAVAWPYANGLQHLGHIAGCYLPGDIFARYHRIAGNDVLMVSGSDAHGTPITVKAEQEGVSPQDIVDRYHPRILEQWERLGISFDLFTSTTTDNHRQVAQELFTDLWDNGYLETRTGQQFFDPEAGRFLPDRYVEGTCPHCDYPEARGDQCDSCGRVLDPEQLREPTSRFTGTTPELRDTEHFFLLLSKLEGRLLDWLEGREGWRAHVHNWALGFIRENGLHERAITRDLEWGVPLPPDAEAALERGEDKRIYVWFEAVIGYLSASREWAGQRGEPEAWRDWWTDPQAETYYFIGKDNIDFHAIFWPAMLLGRNDGADEQLNLPTDVPANQYVTFRGEKASKSRGIGTPVLEWLEDVDVDELRYAVAATLPEYSDTDLTREQLQQRINDELVATWGNLVNRVLSMIRSYFDGVVPRSGDRDEVDEELLETVDRLLAEEGELMEQVELRAALRKALEAAKAANAYLNRREPWQTAGSDRARTGTTLHTALQAVQAVNVGMAPYVPFSAERLHEALGGESPIRDWKRAPVAPGQELGDPGPLYTKVELTGD